MLVYSPLKVHKKLINVCENGIIIISNNDELVLLNEEASRIFGSNKADINTEYLKNKVKLQLTHDAKSENFLEAIYKQKNIENTTLSVGSISLPVSIKTNKFHMTTLEDDFWRTVAIKDISSELDLQERASDIESYKDLLTGLRTRYHLSRDLIPIVIETTKHRNESAVGTFGIKDLHYLRVSYGVEEMDIMLKIIAKEITNLLAKNETMYRLDSDSFAILFEDCGDKNYIRQRLDKIVERVQALLLGERFRASTMQGLYFLNKIQPATAEIVINESLRLLRSKDNELIMLGEDGDSPLNLDRRSTPRQTPDRRNAIRYTYDLTKEDFKHAIQNKDFFFFYQPIYDFKKCDFIGIEVLTRLNHKKYGFLVAGDFLGKTVEHGMASEITEFLLDNVLAQKNFCTRSRKEDLELTINLSLSDLKSGVFAELLEKKMLEYSVDPASIILDIPEVFLEEDFESVLEEFFLLNKIGVKLSIDHFGANTINLKYIEQLPLHSIKIDKSIIRNINENVHKKKLLSSIVSIGNTLGVKVGASHVDSLHIKEILEKNNCDFAQGHYFGKAVPAFEINDLMNNS